MPGDAPGGVGAGAGDATNGGEKAVAGALAAEGAGWPRGTGAGAPAAGRGGPACAGEIATVLPRPRGTGAEGGAAGACAGRFAGGPTPAEDAWAARMPCGGVCGEKGFGDVSRGSSAPHPRQNL